MTSFGKNIDKEGTTREGRQRSGVFIRVWNMVHNTVLLYFVHFDDNSIGFCLAKLSSRGHFTSHTALEEFCYERDC